MPDGSGSLQLNVRYDVVRPGISAIAETSPASSVGGAPPRPGRLARGSAVEPNGSAERSTAVPTRTNLAPSVAVSSIGAPSTCSTSQRSGVHDCGSRPLVSRT